MIRAVLYPQLVLNRVEQGGESLFVKVEEQEFLRIVGTSAESDQDVDLYLGLVPDSLIGLKVFLICPFYRAVFAAMTAVLALNPELLSGCAIPEFVVRVYAILGITSIEVCRADGLMNDD